MENKALPHPLQPYSSPMCSDCNIRQAQVFWHGVPYCSLCAWVVMRKEIKERRKGKNNATNIPGS